MNKHIFNCKSLIIGHRGSMENKMENTMESILHAIRTGVDGIEIDIQMCKTGELIVFHDKTVDRLCFKDEFYFTKTQNIPINKLQWHHIYNTDLIDSIGRRYKIPKLSEVLRCPEIYLSDILINLEIKDNICHEKVCDLITELVEEGLYKPNRFLLTSYGSTSTNYIKEYKEDQNYMDLGVGQIYDTEIPKTYEGFTHIVINKDLLDYISEINNNIKIFVYTVNDPTSKIKHLVDGLITDKPSRF